MDSVWFSWSTVGTFYADFASGKNFKLFLEKNLNFRAKLQVLPIETSSPFRWNFKVSLRRFQNVLE